MPRAMARGICGNHAENRTGQTMRNLKKRERDTILAALRLWQRDGHTAPGEIQEIADNGNIDSRLNDTEIDALCERLNTVLNRKG